MLQTKQLYIPHIDMLESQSPMRLYSGMGLPGIILPQNLVEFHEWDKYPQLK